MDAVVLDLTVDALEQLVYAKTLPKKLANAVKLMKTNANANQDKIALMILLFLILNQIATQNLNITLAVLLLTLINVRMECLISLNAEIGMESVKKEVPNGQAVTQMQKIPAPPTLK